MTLTPVVKSGDPLFNHKAAAWAYETVMKMDADEAAALVPMVVAETLQEEIAKNHRTLQRHLNDVIAKRQRMLERALDRVVSKGGQVDLYREALDEVSKATRRHYEDVGDVMRDWDESKVRRDREGQFTFKVAYSGEKDPIKTKYARGIPSMPSPDSVKMKGLNAEQKRRYQEGYFQVAQFLKNVPAISSDTGNTKILYHIRDNSIDAADGGRIYTISTSGDNTKVPDFNPKYEEIVGMEVRPPAHEYVADKNSAQVPLATFGLLSALGESPARAGAGARHMNTLDQNIESFATGWTGAGAAGESIGSSNARLYGRMANGANFLSQFQTPGSHSWIASQFAQFAGERGPEAEKVIGPKIRRTMYRYRGVEKKPESDIVTRYNQERGFSATMLTGEERSALRTAENRALALALQNKRRAHPDQAKETVKLDKDERKKAIEGARAQLQGVQAKTAEEAAEYMTDRGRAALVNIMLQRVPAAAYYDLQLKAGHTPPSEGLLMDKNGKIVAQAVGYADDHYLPFNLSKLQKLRGGSYIRTRSVGGPTTEDIYTGLVMGARQLTVVSRSGVFTVTFEPDFTHMRRYNDKAARMVKRYGKILDAVQSQQADRMSLPLDVQQSIEREVRATNPWVRGDELNKLIRAKEMEYKLYPRLTNEQRAEIERAATQAVAAGRIDQRTANEWKAQKINDLLNENAYVWKLNGEGYSAALEALHEQFPYYLSKPIYETKREGIPYEANTDRGYVKARFLRPEQAQEGYFDATIAGESAQSAADKSKTRPHGKTRADMVDYQNWKHNKNNVPTKPAAAAEGAAEGKGKDAVKAAEDKAVEELASRHAARKLADHAAVIYEGFLGTTPEGVPRLSEALRTKYPRLFKTATRDEFIDDFPARKLEFERFGREYADATGPSGKPYFEPEERRAWREYQAGMHLAGGEKWDRTKHLTAVPSNPYTDFGNPGIYSPTADRATRDAEMKKLNEETPLLPDGKELASFKESNFRPTLEKLRDLREVRETIAKAPDAQHMFEVLNRQGLIPAGVSPELAQMNDEGYDHLVENVHKYWRLFRNSQGATDSDMESWATELTTPDAGPAEPPTPSGPTTPPSGTTPSGAGAGAAIAGAITGKLRPVQKPAQTKAVVHRGDIGQAEVSSPEARKKAAQAEVASPTKIPERKEAEPEPDTRTQLEQDRSWMFKAWERKLTSIARQLEGTGKPGDKAKAQKVRQLAGIYMVAADKPTHPSTGIALKRSTMAVAKEVDEPIFWEALARLEHPKEWEADVSKNFAGHLVPLPKITV